MNCQHDIGAGSLLFAVNSQTKGKDRIRKQQIATTSWCIRDSPTWRKHLEDIRLFGELVGSAGIFPVFVRMVWCKRGLRVCVRYRTAHLFGDRRRAFGAFSSDSVSCTELLFSFMPNPLLTYKMGAVPGPYVFYLLSKCGYMFFSTTL